MFCCYVTYRIVYRIVTTVSGYYRIVEKCIVVGLVVCLVSSYSLVTFLSLAVQLFMGRAEALFSLTKHALTCRCQQNTL